MHFVNYIIVLVIIALQMDKYSCIRCFTRISTQMLNLPTVTISSFGGKCSHINSRYSRVSVLSMSTASGSSKINVSRDPPQEKLEKLKIKTWPTWGCDVSRFPWSYSETETCYIIRGKAIIIPKDGSEPVEIQKGDLCTFPEGLSCIWDVKEPIFKHYYFN